MDSFLATCAKSQVVAINILLLKIHKRLMYVLFWIFFMTIILHNFLNGSVAIGVDMM